MTIDPERSATEEAGSTPVEPGLPDLKESSRSFLASARKDLSEEELTAPAVRRFLIWEVERLEKRLSETQPFIEKYHDLRVEKAALDERVRGSKLNDVLSAVCLSAGSAGVGAASKYLPLDYATGGVLLVVSAILLVAGIVAKARK